MGVLIVDDEAVMLEVSAMILEDAGAKTFCATSGAEALRVFAEHSSGISCVVLDFSMPDLNGYDVYQRLMTLNSKLGIVFISGLKKSKEVEDLVRAGDAQFLSKPFGADDLIAAVHTSCAPRGRKGE